jgi:hypothetical protein
MTTPNRKTLDALANRVLEIHAEFDARLHGKQRGFPDQELRRLFESVQQYCAGMEGLDWLHPEVARAFSGLREYLQLEKFKSPGEALALADRMECMLFAGYDPFFDGAEPPLFEDEDWDRDQDFGMYEGFCAACDDPGRIDDLGLCRDCGGKFERDLLRQRDWAYSATAFGLSAEQREAARKEIVEQFGKNLELIAAPNEGKAKRKRKGRKPKVR